MTTRSLLFLVVAFMLLITPLLAALPVFEFPDGTPPNQIARFTKSFRDALALAKTAAITFQGRCDPVYQRYFDGDADAFVKHIYQTIANIELDSTGDASDLPTILADEGVANLNPKFGSLRISFGEPADIPPFGKGQCSKMKGFGAFLVGNMDATGLMVICVNILGYPMADEIEYPRPWAKDAQGNLKPGYSCDGLGDHDTTFRLFPGAFILHELMHWSFFFKDVPDWNNYISIDPRFQGPVISDFKRDPNNLIGPSTGYGAFNTMNLRAASIQFFTQTRVRYQTLNNADSYMWYALSKYWQFVCKKSFGPARSASDDARREDEGGAYGQSFYAMMASDQPDGSDVIPPAAPAAAAPPGS